MREQTDGAIRAAEIITGGKYNDQVHRYETEYGTKTVQGVAAIIERHTQAKVLTDTLRECLREFEASFVGEEGRLNDLIPRVRDLVEVDEPIDLPYNGCFWYKEEILHSDIKGQYGVDHMRVVVSKETGELVILNSDRPEGIARRLETRSKILVGDKFRSNGSTCEMQKIDRVRKDERGNYWTEGWCSYIEAGDVTTDFGTLGANNLMFRKVRGKYKAFGWKR